MPTSSQRAALSPENLGIIEAVARHGSMAAAARELGMVPSALTYRVRQIEESLDLLLFDRSARNARITPAGAELLRAGRYLLEELDAVVQRVQRVASGWEPQLVIAADALICWGTMLELCDAFYASGAPTRLRILGENLSGTLEALQGGEADLALGVVPEATLSEIHSAPIGSVRFVFVVAPHHPLAAVMHDLCDEEVRQHRAIVVADSTRRGSGLSFNLLPGQEVLTVPTMEHKLAAQLRGLGVGYLPEPLARPHIDVGRLVEKPLERAETVVRAAYAWRQPPRGGPTGKALHWWLQRLERPVTRRALLERHA